MNFPTASFFLLAGLFGSTTASAGVNCLVGASLTVCCSTGCGAYGWECEGGTGNYLNPGGTIGGACALEAPSYEERIMMKAESGDSSDDSSDTGFYDEEEELRADEIEAIRSDDRSDESSDTGFYDEEEELRADEIEAKPERMGGDRRTVGTVAGKPDPDHWTYVNYANIPGGGYRHDCGIVEDETDVNGHTCP